MSRRPTRQRGSHCLALYRQGNLEQAVRCYQELVAKAPGDVDAWNMLAAILGQLGALAQAEASCHKVLSLAPGHVGAHINLGNVLTAAGRVQEAEAAYLKARQMDPANSQIASNLGNLLLARGSFAAAAQHLRQAVSLAPDRPEPHNNLACALVQLGDLDGAMRHVSEALRLKPDYPDALLNRGNIESEWLRVEAAEASYRKVLRMSPGHATAHCHLGKLLQSDGRYDAADAEYQTALRLRPGDPETLAAYATLLERRREGERALELLRPALQAGCEHPKLLLSQANVLRRLKRQGEACDVLHRLLRQPLAPRDAGDVHFLLGDCHDDLGEYDRAFAHYTQGNRIDNHPFDLAEEQDELRRRMAVFSRSTLARLPRSRTRSDLPVFIVGMPRSGTTLTEQILAAHPEVHGAGEASRLERLVARVVEVAGSNLPYPDCVTTLDDGQAERLAVEFLGELHSLAPEAHRIADKTPLHFYELGLAQMLLPGSRVVHCRRDPLDTCLSIYFHRFNAYHKYASDLRNLGRYYRLYDHLMAYWAEQLDLPMFEAVYEQTVEDQPGSSRALIEFCGLEWDPACLEFHRSDRDVHTPSYHQVRRPIYRSSMGRWRHYERHLGPLLAGLDEDVRP